MLYDAKMHFDTRGDEHSFEKMQNNRQTNQTNKSKNKKNNSNVKSSNTEIMNKYSRSNAH